MRYGFAIAVALLVLAASHAVTAAETGTEVERRSSLRVCADPSNLPFSNRQEQGFENKIAELLAAELGTSLRYTWFPQSLGFVRSTLKTRRCDLIIGISAAHELVQNSNPYYASVFAAVQRADSDFDVKSLSDNVLKERKLRIGVTAGAPPVDIILANGLIEQMTPYQLRRADMRNSRAEEIERDLIDKKIDVAVVWGPIAGYMVRRNDALKLAPLTADNSQKHRLIFPITMGIRRNELQWRRQLNKLIRKNQDKIHDILRSYHVPLVDPS